jgi:betaine-aldehyde dehydrogenase
MDERKQFFIGGAWVDSAATGTIDVIGASTEEVIGRVPDGAPADIDRAVAAAREAFDRGPWSTMSPAARAGYLTALSQALQARADDLTQTITAENGSPIMLCSMLQLFPATMTLDYYATLATETVYEERRDGMLGGIVVQRVPVGVVAAIVPWNVPLYTAALKLGPALAAGCTVVLKPSPETALDSYLLADAIEEIGLPPGVVNVVVADRTTSEYLVTHPGVDKVAFTGSTAAGRKIAAACGELLRPVTLELGGKSAAIVLDDADAAQVAESLLPMGSMMFSGQACIAQTRILAPRGRYDEVVEALVEKVKTLPVGDPFDPTTVFGPLVASRQRDRVESYIAIGQEEGAKVAVGGGRPANLSKGWYVEPTVLTNVDNGMRVAREEIFGPVAVVIPYDDTEEAIRLANDSDYGLGGGVYSADTDRALDVARQIRTGTITLNGIALETCAPFGGVKQSGLGRELGPEGLAAYFQLKSIMQVPQAPSA